MEQKLIGTTTVFFTNRCREKNKGILKLTHPAMLAEEENLRWLDSVHLDDVAASMDTDLRTAAENALSKGTVLLANTAWKTADEWENGFRKIIRRKSGYICWHWEMLAVLC